MSAALNRIPRKVSYSGDFEVTRGRTVNDKEASKYVRLRREITDAYFNNILYSLSIDEKNMTETFVFKTKDPKDLVAISIEDQVTAGAVMPTSMFDADEPATHIKLERFGKTAIALARCENADQSAYEPLFSQATQLMAQYRNTLGLHSAFRSDIAWLSASSTPAKSDKPTRPGTSKPGTKSNPASPAPETKPTEKHLN